MVNTIHKMNSIVSQEIEPKITSSMSCVSCSIAYKCPSLQNEAFNPVDLTKKRKVLQAALNQVDSALGEIAVHGDFHVGKEKYGFVENKWYASNTIRQWEVPEILRKLNPKLLKRKSKVTIDAEVKNFLHKKGYKDFAQRSKKTLTWLNQKELRNTKKSVCKEQTTIADKKSA